MNPDFTEADALFAAESRRVLEDVPDDDPDDERAGFGRFQPNVPALFGE